MNQSVSVNERWFDNGKGHERWPFPCWVPTSTAKDGAAGGAVGGTCYCAKRISILLPTKTAKIMSDLHSATFTAKNEQRSTTPSATSPRLQRVNMNNGRGTDFSSKKFFTDVLNSWKLNMARSEDGPSLMMECCCAISLLWNELRLQQIDKLMEKRERQHERGNW